MTHKSVYFPRKYKRILGYDGKIDEGSGIVSSAVRDVIKRSEVLNLHGCNALEGLADEDGLQANAFANLEYLDLVQLTNLRSILCGCCEISTPMPLKDNFKSLQVLVVTECPMLKQLFSSWGLLSQFIHLEELVIWNCKGLEEMISVDNDDDDEIGNNNSWTPLPKLKHLGLEKLEEFVGFFSKGNNNVLLLLRWPSLERLDFRKCPKLKRFPFGAGDDDLQRLKILELENLPEFTGFGDGDGSYRRRCWPSLKEVRIVKCPKLKMLPFGAHDDLQSLERLTLAGLSEFVGFSEGDVSYTSCCWPSLWKLTLSNCPKLETFPLAPHNLPKLQYLKLENLPEFAGFGDGDVSRRRCWPSLEVVRILECPKLKMLPFEAHDDLQSLKELKLEELSEFVGFSKGDVSYTSCCWPSLWMLTLSNCPKLETFPLAPLNLPKLQYLELHNLPDLVSLGQKRRNDTNTSFTTMCWESFKRVHFFRCPKLEIFPFGGR